MKYDILFKTQGSIVSPDQICLNQVLAPFHVLNTSSQICKAHGELYQQASTTEGEKPQT